jgi:chromosomal replication initiator protein
VEEIIKIVGAKLNVKIADIKAHNKNKNFVLARQISMYLARKLTNLSFPDIGQKIGGRDHSTVIYANKKIAQQLETNANTKKMVNDIEENIINRSS